CRVSSDFAPLQIVVQADREEREDHARADEHDDQNQGWCHSSLLVSRRRTTCERPGRQCYSVASTASCAHASGREFDVRECARRDMKARLAPASAVGQPESEYRLQSQRLANPGDLARMPAFVPDALEQRV